MACPLFFPPAVACCLRCGERLGCGCWEEAFFFSSVLGADKGGGGDGRGVRGRGRGEGSSSWALAEGATATTASSVTISITSSPSTSSSSSLWLRSKLLPPLLSASESSSSES